MNSSDAPSLRESPDLAANLTEHRAALYMCAAHCQGGHSDAGSEAARVLCVSFPIRMTELIIQARAEGFNPAALWPWMWRVTHQGRQSWFTAAEVESARKDGASLNSSPPQPKATGATQ